MENTVIKTLNTVLFICCLSEVVNGDCWSRRAVCQGPLSGRIVTSAVVAQMARWAAVHGVSAPPPLLLHPAKLPRPFTPLLSSTSYSMPINI